MPLTPGMGNQCSVRVAVVLLGLLLADVPAAATRGVVMLDVDGETTQLYGSSHALLIGNSDYTAGWPDLESVPRELEKVKRALEAQGFQVDKRMNLDSEAMKDAFEDFIAAHGYGAENRLLFFYSGHGHTWDEIGQGYLVPVDAPLPASASGHPGTEFLRKALHMSQVLAWSRQMTAKHALFLFDSCFSGTIFKTKSLPGQPPHITRATTLKVRQFITAGSAGEEVPARSVFTPAFVDALELGWGDLNKDGYISGVELGLYLQAKVPKHAAQSPQFGKHPDYALSRGDFVLESTVAAAAAVSSATPAATTTPAAATVPPPPPPVQFLGNVQVNVNVPATVYLAGTEAGEALPGRPLNKQGVPSGSLVVRVETEGFQSAEQQVQVRRGQWEQLVFELQPLARMANLTVRSNVHGDQVFIDGVARGSTRLDVELAPGRHAVRVEKDGYTPYERQLDLEAGAAVVVRAQLNRVQEPPPAASARETHRSRTDPVGSLQARRQEACERECLETRRLCEEEEHRTVEAFQQRCLEEGGVHCAGVYEECRRTGTMVGGEVSRDSECSGRQQECEHRVVAKCEHVSERKRNPWRCEREAGECLEGCQQ